MGLNCRLLDGPGVCAFFLLFILLGYRIGLTGRIDGAEQCMAGSACLVIESGGMEGMRVDELENHYMC